MGAYDPRQTVAITWHDTKQAALYYDRIFPCCDYSSVPVELRVDYTTLESTYRKLAYEYESNDPTISEWDDFVKVIHDPMEAYDDETEWVANDYVIQAAAALAGAGRGILAICKEDVYDGHYRLLSPEYYEARRRWHEENGRRRGEPTPPSMPTGLVIDEAIEVQLMNMDLVDTTDVPWEQVSDFRRDRESQEMLRDMRLLISKEIQGRSSTEIEDYVHSKLDRHDRACRKHGFETIESSIQIVLRAKSLFALGATAAYGAFSGNWDLVAGAMSGGVAIGASQVTLNLIKCRRDFVFMSRDAEFGYLIAARRAFER